MRKLLKKVSRRFERTRGSDASESKDEKGPLHDHDDALLQLTPDFDKNKVVTQECSDAEQGPSSAVLVEVQPGAALEPGDSTVSLQKYATPASRSELISASIINFQITLEIQCEYKQRLLDALGALSAFYSFRYHMFPRFDKAAGKMVQVPDEGIRFTNELYAAIKSRIDHEIEQVKTSGSSYDVQASFAEGSDFYSAEYEAKSVFIGLAIAIELGNIAILLSRPGEKARNRALLGHAERMMERVHCTADTRDMLVALHYAETCIADMDDDSPIEYVAAFRRYGQLLYGAYEETYAIGFLDDAIQTIRDHTAWNNPDKSNPHVLAPNNLSWLKATQTLSRCLEARYRHSNDLNDLRLSMLLADFSVEVAQRDNLLQKDRDSDIGLSLLWTLGAIQLTRFRLTRDISLLKGCISNLKGCLSLTSIDHMEWPTRSETLSDAYRELMKIENLKWNRAQAMLRLEVPYLELKAEGNEYHDVSSALGLEHLVFKSRSCGSLAAQENEPSRTPVLWVEQRKMKFACYARIANKLADLLAESAEAEKQELKEAKLQPAKQSETDSVDEEARSALVNKVISNAYGREAKLPAQYDRVSKKDCSPIELWHQNSLKYFREIANSYECKKLERAHAAYRAMTILVEDGDYTGAYDLAELAAQQVANIDLTALTLKDQEYLLRQLSGLPGWAATLALRNQKPAAKVMELLEATRARITGVAVDLRRDISILRQSNPDLADKYEEIRRSLYPRGMSGAARLVVFERNGKLMAQRLSQTVRDFNKVHEMRVMTQQVQKEVLIQFNPLSGDNMILAARYGPLVSFTITTLGSHAILVTKAGVVSISLPKLTKQDVDENLKLVAGETALYKGLASTEWERNIRLRCLLEWLWDSAVLPVLNFLGMSKGNTDQDGAGPLPRIWWVNGGPISAFPLHAAGRYGTNPTDNAMARVISSYTSSVRMLEHLRSISSTATHNERQQAVIVSMPTTHGMAPLPHAGEESDYVKDGLKCSENIDVVSLDKPTKHEVVDRIESATLLHLICHGQANQTSPSDGYLVLDNKTHDAAAQLTIEEIGSVKTQGAQFAYVSACSSAEHGSVGLVDEVIHLANGFQMVGVPKVVATLWPVDDEASASIAQQFYQVLNTSDPGQYDTAESLHKAVRNYMLLDDGISSNTECFLSWVPLVHYGI